MNNKVFDILHRIYKEFEHTTCLSKCVESTGFPEVYYAKYVAKSTNSTNQSIYYIYENEPCQNQLEVIPFHVVFTIINDTLYMYELPRKTNYLKRKIITTNFNIEFVDNN